MEHGIARLVAEPDAVEDDVLGVPGERQRRLRVADARFTIQHRIDPVGGRGAGLEVA